MPEPIVATHELSKSYGRLQALAACTLAVEAGEAFGLLGPNGAGKSTLLRTMLGFLRPSGGRATIAGFDCRRESLEVRRRTSYLPGDARLFRGMRGRAVLRLFSRLRGQPDERRGLELAERLGLDTSRIVAFMSTGMRQKLALAVALSPDVPLYVLDEPTSNLDPSVRSIVLSLVRELRDAGRTVLFSSHVLSEVEAACDRVAILRAGRLVHVQRMAELKRKHRIRVRVTGTLPAVPAALAGDVEITHDQQGQVTLLTAGELAPLVGWLSGLPITDMRVEPLGLQAVYDEHHEPG